MFTSSDEPDDGQVHVLSQSANGQWLIYDELSLSQPKNKDMVVFELDKPIDRYVNINCWKHGLRTMGVTDVFVAKITRFVGVEVIY